MTVHAFGTTCVAERLVPFLDLDVCAIAVEEPCGSDTCAPTPALPKSDAESTPSPLLSPARVSKGDPSLKSIKRVHFDESVRQSLYETEPCEFMISSIGLPENLTPLAQALCEGRLRDVKRLVREGGPDAVNAPDLNGWRPIHIAAYCGKKIGAEHLIGAEINAPNAEGNTALHLAANQGHGPMVKALVDWGADLYSKNARSWMPLRVAIHAKNGRICEYLAEQQVKQRTQQPSAIDAKIPRKQYADIKMLPLRRKEGNPCQDAQSDSCPPGVPQQSAPWSVDTQEENWANLCTLAAQGDFGAVVYMLRRLPDYHFACDSSSQNTLMHIAAAKGHQKIVGFLVRTGGNPFQRNAENKTPRMVAQHANHRDVCNYLEEAETLQADTVPKEFSSPK